MQEFYKSWLREKLEKYLEVRVSHAKLLQDIEYLETKLEGKTVASYGESLGYSSSGSADEKFLNKLAELDVLKTNYEESLKLINDVEYAIAGLNDMELDILLTLYGTKKRDNKVERLMKKYNYQERQIYRIGNYAAKEVSVKLFGDR